MLLVLTGPTGSGKDTVAKKLCTMGWTKLVTYTTRSIRPGEVNGVHYYFLSESEFLSMKARGEFLEINCYGDSWYGTSKKSIEAALYGQKILWIIDSGTAAKIRYVLRENLSLQTRDSVLSKTRVVYLDPGSWDDLEKRLILRDGNDPEIIVKRQKRLAQDWKIWESCYESYDAIVKNEDGKLGETLDNLLAKLA